MNYENNNNSRTFTSKMFNLIFIFILLYSIIFIFSLKLIKINKIYNEYLNEINNINDLKLQCDGYYNNYYYKNHKFECENNDLNINQISNINEEKVKKISKKRIILNVFSLIFFTVFLIRLIIEKKIIKISLFLFIIRFIIINAIFLFEIISDFIIKNQFNIDNFMFRKNEKKFNKLEKYSNFIFKVYIISGIYNILNLSLIYIDFIYSLNTNHNSYRYNNILNRNNINNINISNNNDNNNSNSNINNNNNNNNNNNDNNNNINNNNVIININNNNGNNNNNIKFRNKNHEKIYNSIMSLSFEIIFDPIKHNSFEEKSCGICLGDFEKDEKILIIPCLHKFHFDCISNWLIKKTTCPFDQLDLEKIVEDTNNHNNIKMRYNQFLDNNINNINIYSNNNSDSYSNFI